MLIPNAPALSLLPRPAYRDMVIAGSPEAFGRIVGMSDDRRTAYVVWRGTPGTLYQFPREPFELEIAEEFIKTSFLYRAEGLSCEVEPL